jgi:hypothetical protein
MPVRKDPPFDTKNTTTYLPRQARDKHGKRIFIIQKSCFRFLHAGIYSAIAVSKGFVGSPHIDTYDVGPQYALSLGDFTGGSLMVEAGPKKVPTRHLT